VKVSATGRLTPEGHFEATQILAKCPSKYEMKDRQTRGEAAPHRGPAGDKDGAEAARAD
jgi:cytochrome c-type biogenesis protein CcmE